MNVPEITILYETHRTVIKHFEASTKSKEILDQIQNSSDFKMPMPNMDWSFLESMFCC